jgi:hypothetical protein
MKTIIKFVIVLTILVGCKKDDISLSLNKKFELMQNESVKIKNGSEEILVKLTQVNDSRCPINANCIRSGEAKIKLDLDVNGVSYKGFELCLICDATMNIPNNKTVGSKYKITLIDVNPYPELAKRTGESKIILIVE